MTKRQFAVALIALLVGGAVGGMIVLTAHPVQGAGVEVSPRRPAAARPPITAETTNVKPRYFTSTMMFGVMTDDNGYQNLPALVVWRYTRKPRGTVAATPEGMGGLEQVRMRRAPQDLVSGEPSGWEYALISAPDKDEVFLYRYRTYESAGEEPVAEYEYLGRKSPSFAGVGDYPGTPE